MALDHALAEGLHQGEGVLRFYAWDPPTISFGRNEPADGLYDRSAAAAEGLGFVRRPTGGRVIHEGLIDGLRSIGVPAGVAEGGSVLAPDAGPCFQAPAPGEVVAGGRKLVGSAQARVGGVTLQHGSVILRGNQDALTRLTGGGEGSSAPATVEDLLGRLSCSNAG